MENWWLVSYLALWGLLLVLSVLVFVLYHHLGNMYLGTIEASVRDGLAEGTPAPPFRAKDPRGSNVEFVPASDRQTFLIFGSTECALCEQILPELDEYAKERSGEIRMVLVFKSTSDRGSSLNDQYGTRFPIWTNDSDAVMKSYQVRVTPFGFLMDEEGIVRAKGVVNGRKHLNHLLRKAKENSRSDQRTLPATQEGNHVRPT